jgi:hypothetical protein
MTQQLALSGDCSKLVVDKGYGGGLNYNGCTKYEGDLSVILSTVSRRNRTG